MLYWLYGDTTEAPDAYLSLDGEGMLFILRRAAQAFCHSPLTSSSLRDVPEDQVRMASGLFNLHRTLAGAVGVALTASLMEQREDLHTLILSQRQDLYPMGTQVATDTIRQVLIEDGQGGQGLEQMTSAVLSQKLNEHIGHAKAFSPGTLEHNPQNVLGTCQA